MSGLWVKNPQTRKHYKMDFRSVHFSLLLPRYECMSETSPACLSELAQHLPDMPLLWLTEYSSRVYWDEDACARYGEVWNIYTTHFCLNHVHLLFANRYVTVDKVLNSRGGNCLSRTSVSIKHAWTPRHFLTKISVKCNRPNARPCLPEATLEN